MNFSKFQLKTELDRFFRISFKLKTLDENSLLFFALNENQLDYILIELYNGKIKLSFGFWTTNKKLQVNSVIVKQTRNQHFILNDLRWHTINIQQV